MDLYQRQGDTYLENGSWRDAVSQEIIKTCANLQQARRRTLSQDLICRQSDKRLPIRRWNRCLVCDFLTVPRLSEIDRGNAVDRREHLLLRIDGLEHK